MRFLVRRTAVVGALLGALVLSPEPANADLFGGDVAELAALLTETLSQGVTLGEQLTQLKIQVDALNTMLSQLDPASANAVLGLINDTTFNYQSLVGDIQSLGYTLQAVNADFASTFPTDYSKTPASSFAPIYDEWQAQIWSSALVAARTQGVLSTIHQNADEAAMVLAASASSSGQVAQLQAVVQMLGIVESQNNSLLQSLATTGRVIAMTASTGASDRQLARERKKRNLAGYTNRGTTVTVPNRLP